MEAAPRTGTILLYNLLLRHDAGIKSLPRTSHLNLYCTPYTPDLFRFNFQHKQMRCSVSLAAISLGFFVSLQAHAFTSTVNQRSLSRRHVSAFESRIESASVMEQIGLDEGRLAIGVDSQEVLTFIGT